MARSRCLPRSGRCLEDGPFGEQAGWFSSADWMLRSVSAAVLRQIEGSVGRARHRVAERKGIVAADLVQNDGAAGEGVRGTAVAGVSRPDGPGPLR